MHKQQNEIQRKEVCNLTKAHRIRDENISDNDVIRYTHTSNV
jgi:hypothetical protein